MSWRAMHSEIEGPSKVDIESRTIARRTTWNRKKEKNTHTKKKQEEYSRPTAFQVDFLLAPYFLLVPFSNFFFSAPCSYWI